MLTESKCHQERKSFTKKCYEFIETPVQALSSSKIIRPEKETKRNEGRERGREGGRKESFSSLGCREIMLLFNWTHLWIEGSIISLNPTMTKETAKSAEIVLSKVFILLRRMLMTKVQQESLIPYQFQKFSFTFQRLFTAMLVKSKL